MKEILFTNAREKVYDLDQSLVKRFEKMLKRFDFSKYINENEYVAIKTHLGSHGAHRLVRPIFLRKIVDEVRRVKGVPFIAETTRLQGLEYLDVAAMQGYTHLTMNCPIVMADGIFGRDAVNVKINGKVLKEVPVASAIYYAPIMIVVSHCKGHIGPGYGGALKNLGMGCLAKNGPNNEMPRGCIHSEKNECPVYNIKECSFCGACVSVCGENAIKVDKVKKKWSLDTERCIRCYRCVHVCPTKALEDLMGEERYNWGQAEGALAVVKTFKDRKIIYINFIMEVQPVCDCMPVNDTPLIQDQGIMIGEDPVAIDQASLDIINKAMPLPESKAEDKGMTKPGDVFKIVNDKNAQLCIDYCEELGMGSKKYKLIDIEKE